MRRPPIDLSPDILTRRLPVTITLAALAIALIVALFTGSTAAPVVTPPVVTAPVTSETVVCPAIDGTPTGTTTRAVVADLAGALTPPSTSTGTVTSTVLVGSSSTTSTLTASPSSVLTSKANVDHTVAITASGSVAATLTADQVGVTMTGRYRALTDTRCESPATDWWFAGADGRVGFSDTLTLSNPAPTAAVVTITLWGPKKQVSNPALQAIRIPPHTAKDISIAASAPDVPNLTVHVLATSGSVAASLLDRRTSGLSTNGADFLPPTAAPSRSAVVAGFSASQGTQDIVLGNPGAVDATVSLKAMTGSGSFVPTGDSQIVIHPGRTIVVNLDRALNGGTGAVQVTADQPVVSEGLSVTPEAHQRPDLIWLAATPPLVGSAAVADGREPNGGHCLLLLSAPAAQAQVRVTAPGGHTRTITVPAGESVEVDITATVKAGGGQNSFVATAVGSAPVYGERVLRFFGTHGAFLAGEPLVALPTPIVLPPVHEDPRVATQ